MSASWMTPESSIDTPRSSFMNIDRAMMAGDRSPIDGTVEDRISLSPRDVLDRRKKPSSKGSCEKCKLRKVKCDRVEPVCGWCSRNGRICVYTTKKTPGPRPDQSHNVLERKVDKLEEKVSEHEGKASQLETMLFVMSRRLEDHIAGDHNIATHPSGPSPNLGSHQQLPRESHSMAIDFGSQPTPAASSQADHIQYTPVSEPVSAFLMEIAPDMHSPGRSGSANSDLWVSELSDRGLPNYELLCNLVDLYFKHINTWCPILDRNSTFDILLERTPPCEADFILFHAIIAQALRFSKDPGLNPTTKKQLYNISKQRVQVYGLENTNIRALQALVILSLDALGTSNGSKGWNLLALVAQTVPKLGLNVETTFSFMASASSAATIQEATLPQPTSWLEDEGRRRLFWMIYVLDRYATVGTGSAFLIDEKLMNRPFPCRYDLFSKNQPVETRWFRGSEQRPENNINKPENLGSFSYHCEVLRIMSSIHEFLSRPIDIGSPTDVKRWQTTYRELDRELDAWLFNLPDEYGKISQFCHSDPNSKISNWLILHAAYVSTVIRLHSAAAYPAVRSHILKPSYNAMQRCLGAVVSLKEVTLDVVNAGMLDLLGPAFAFSLWVASRLLLVHSSITEHDLDPNLGFFITTLAQMGQYWSVAQKYAETLTKLVDEYQLSKQTQRRESYVRVNKLAEMRSRAYELRLLMSQTRQSILSPTSSLIPRPNELEYLDVFDYYNYPILQTKPVNPVPVPDRCSMPDNRNMMNRRGIINDRNSSLDDRNMSDLMVMEEEFQQPVNNSLFICQYAAPDANSDWLAMGRQTENTMVQ